MRQAWLVVFLAGAVLLSVARDARGQEAGARLDVRVEHVAGENAYLSAGIDDGLATGDTLDVVRGDVRLGQVRVVSATAGRAVVAFVGAAFPITRGTELTIVRAMREAPEPVAETRPEPVPSDSARTSIFAQPAAPASPSGLPRPTGPRFAGRVQFGTTALWSSTSPLSGAGDTTTRSFATPFLSLRGRVSDLPADLLVNVHGRVSYRYRSVGSFDEPTDLRLYHASVERRMGLVHVEAGRFYNEYDRYSGYLDGARLRIGSETAGVGVTGGLQPRRADGIFSSELPKVTVFGHYRLSPRPLRIDLSAVAGQVLPQSEGLETRTFAGATARVFGDGASLSADVLVDRDPDGGDLALSRFLVRGAWSVLPGLRLRGRYYHRRPYILFDDFQELREASVRYGGGLSYRLGGEVLRGTVLRADLSQATRDGESSLTYSGGIYVPRLPALDLGLNASGSLWTRDGRESIYALAALTRSFGPVYVSLGYQYQQTPLLTESLTTHGIEGTLQVPLMDGVSATVQASGHFGETIQNARLYTGLWWRL
jgi:hypothetical protein